MAESNDKSSKQKVETVRERAERAIAEAAKAPKKAKTESAAKVKKTLFRRKPKADKIEKKHRFHLFPRFFKLAWQELRQVTWPDRKTTVKLTFAVILFSLIFSALVSVIDYGLGIVFKKVFLHG